MLINHYLIDCSDSYTNLCEIGAKYGTDKSIIKNELTKEYYNYDYKHAYTNLYSMIFSQIKNESINFGEIGIAHNASIKMWREYFKNAKIYAWDGSIDLLERAKKDNLKDVVYDYMHTQYEESIINSFSKYNVKYNVLIDDASHLFWDQIRLIRLSTNYLYSGAFLIIEDIDNNIPEDYYISSIKEYCHDEYYDSISFVKFNHNQQSLGDYDNHKILLLVRSNKD